MIEQSLNSSDKPPPPPPSRSTPLSHMSDQQHTKNRNNNNNSRTPLLLCLLSLLVTPTNATVTVEETGTKYASRPATFGFKFSNGLQYVANLMLPPHLDTYLCGGEEDLMEHEDNWPVLREDHNAPFWWDGNMLEDKSHDVMYDDDDDDGGKDDMAKFFKRNFEKEENENEYFFHGRNLKGGFFDDDDVKDFRLSDNVPVAILAKRGECTYETKARNALKLKATYVIVYDDRHERSLISMAATSDNVSDLDNVGLLFVSNKDGRELLQTVYEQRGSLSGNQSVRVLLDGYSQWWPDYAGDPIGWVGLIFMVFMCISTLSLFMTTNFFRGGAGGIINIQQENGGATSRRRQGPRLLTEDEVMTLPEVRYRGEVAMSTMRRSSDDDCKLKTSESLGDDDDDDVNNGEQPSPSADASTVSSDNESQCDHYTDTCCTICLEDYEPGEKLRVLPCQHSFHSECIIPWLTTRSPTCPLCKTYFEATSDGEEEEEDQAAHDENGATEEGNGDGASQQNADYDEVEEETNGTRGERPGSGHGEDMSQQENEGIWGAISGAGGGLRRIFHHGGTTTGSNGRRDDNNSTGLEEPLLQENQRSGGDESNDIV